MITKDNLSKMIFAYRYKLLECIRMRKDNRLYNTDMLDIKIAMYKMFIDDMEKLL